LIDAVGGLLKQPTDQRVGGLENGRAHQGLQLRDHLRSRRLGLEAGDQLLDFLILGEEDIGGNLGFFF